MVYAEFGGQTECIMGNWKIENEVLLREAASHKSMCNKRDLKWGPLKVYS